MGGGRVGSGGKRPRAATSALLWLYSNHILGWLASLPVPHAAYSSSPVVSPSERRWFKARAGESL